MALIALTQQIHTLAAGVETVERRSAQLNSNIEVVTMNDIVDTVNNGTGGVSGSGTTSFLPMWSGTSALTDSNIEKTATYSAPNGGQYELRGNLKIFGESTISGVAALFIEDNTRPRVEVRDVTDLGVLNSQLVLEAGEGNVLMGTQTGTPDVPIDIIVVGSGKFRVSTINDGTTDLSSFYPINTNTCLGKPDGNVNTWKNIHFNLPEYADEAAATAAGLIQFRLYQTDGTGSAPLNVAGIVMVKQ